MGAKVQCNTYLPGYYHMRDLNDDTRSTICSQFYDDRMMKSGPFCNGFMQQSRDGYSEYDKEVLKQTMLKHEAIFRKQVCELHRLYQVQKNLMDDLKRKEMIEYSLPLEAMHDGQCILQMRSDNSEKICQMAMPSVGSSSCSRQSASETDNMQSSLTLLRENSSLQKYSELQSSKMNKLPRKTIDLRLPADEYIDIEDREASIEEVKVFEASSGSFCGIKYPLERNLNMVPESEVKLTLGPGLNASTSGDHHRSETHLLHSIHVSEISELNVNHRERNKEVATSFGIPDIFNDEIRAKELRSQAGGSPFGLLKDHIQGSNTENIHRHWISLDSECERSKGDRQSSNLRPGHYGSVDTPFAQRYRNGKEQFNFGKSHEIPRFCLSEQQQESWFKDQRNAHAEFPKVNLIDTRAARATSLSTSFPVTFSVLSRPDLSDTAPAEIFTQKNSASTSNQLPFGFQSPAYLDRSMGQNFPGRIPLTPFQSAEFSEQKWHPSGSLRSCQRIDLEVPPRHDSFKLSARAADRSYPSFTSTGLGKLDLNNGECSSHGQSADSGPRKLLKGMDSLDVKSNRSVSLSLVLQNGFTDDAASWNQNSLLVDKGGKRGNILEGQPMRSHEAETKTYPSNSLLSNNGIGQPRLGLSRLIDQPTLIIDLEKPILEVEPETEAPSEKPTCDVGSVSQSNGGPGAIQQLVVSHAHKNESTCAPEAGIVQSSCSGRLNFFQEPFALQLSPESMKDCSKSNGFKTHKHVDKPQESLHNDLKVHNFQKQVSREQAHGHHTYEGSLSTSLGLCEGKSIHLEEGVNEQVNLFGMEHESTTKGIVSKEEKLGHIEQEIKSIAEETPQDPGINLAQHSNRNVGKIHQLDLNWPGDAALSQGPELPAILVEKISCTEKSKRFDCSLGDELRWSSSGCSIESSNSLVTVAAEALIMISSFSQEKSEDFAWNEPEAALTDSLKWFADLVCPDSGLLESNTKASGSNGDDSHSSEEDLFESMTLMLREDKMDKDYCYQSQPHQEPGGPETDASPAKNQPTRRAPRRGRRQRDFQRDILPGLMSLSRHEVSEDMQMICSMMRASGCFWQPVVARRNGYRNEWSSPTRGRRSRCISMAVEVNEAVLAVLQPTSDPEIIDETVSLKGFSWGKTTRRRRMQRCPSSIPTSCTTKKS
ncbi:uncharacterized protein LOC116258644 [Nymphaea colorata]|nr:uncharacterized protein LOC116258644 [Nymphaea colorata]